MNPILQIAIGVTLGALGAALHLAVTRLRVRWTSEHHETRALATLPLVFLGPAIAFFVALNIGHVAAWSTLFGLFVVHRVVFWRMRAA